MLLHLCSKSQSTFIGHIDNFFMLTSFKKKQKNNTSTELVVRCRIKRSLFLKNINYDCELIHFTIFVQKCFYLFRQLVPASNKVLWYRVVHVLSL